MAESDITLKKHQVACLVLVYAAILTVSLWGGMLYDRVNPSPELSGVMNLIGFPISAGLSIAALAVALWMDDGRWRVGLMSIKVGGFVVLAAVSIFGSPHLHASLTSFSILASAAALGWAVVSARLPRTALFGAAMALVTAGSLVAALGISEYIGHIARPPRDFAWRVFSTFAAPNFLAGYLVMTLPMAAAGLLAARERLVKLLCGLGLALQAACLLLTGSRFGIVSLAAALVIFVVLVARRGLVRGTGGKRGKVAAAVILTVALLGSIPIGLRLFRSGAESHSSLFRVYTWRGAARLTGANPLLGAGLGSFDVAYAPHAEVAYTQHAHNSYLQLAGEAGVPALLLLLALSGTALGRAFASARKDSEDSDTSWSESAAGLLSAGTAAGLIGALVRNLFDSDLYIPANALTFGLLCGLAYCGFRTSRTFDSVSSTNETILRRFLAGAAFAFALVHIVLYSVGRLHARAGEIGIQGRSLDAALEGYRSAARWDFLNAEYRLKLAGIQAASGDVNGAEKSFLIAEGLLRSGKPRYQAAQFMKRQGRMDNAVVLHERAREFEPNNLQNLVSLAEAYAELDRAADAERVYERLVQLYESPFGRIRAVPELIEYEFGEAHRALGEMARMRGENVKAETHLRKALEILGEYWARRKNPMVQVQLRSDKSLFVGTRYEKALTGLADVLTKVGRTDEARTVMDRRAVVSEEIRQESADSAKGPGE